MEVLSTMRILAIDASTEACSVALWHEGDVDCLLEIAPQQHTRIILPMIQQLLAKKSVNFCDCDAIAFAEGPGSFTGLRIAAGVAQGIAFAYNIPLIAVSTLAGLALAAKNLFSTTNFFVTALDARMDEVYFALYVFENQLMKPVIPDSLANPTRAASLITQHLLQESWIGVGTGIAIIEKKINPVAAYVLSNNYPSAQEIALLAVASYHEKKFVTVKEALPKYLRNEIIKK